MYKAPLNERGFSILVMGIMRIEVWRMKKPESISGSVQYDSCIYRAFGQTPLARRLPKLPGFRNINHVEYLPVNVSRIEKYYEAGEVVDGESLVAKGIIKHSTDLVKVLGDGEITKAVTVKVDKVSASAKAKIEAAGGKVEEPC